MLSQAEIEALQPPPNQSVVEWVEAHRVLPKGSAIPGAKKISNTPALRIVYDWFYDYKIREITCQKPAQCGFTDLIVDLILWISDNDPAPTALFLADQDTARKIMKFRIIPALKEMGKIGDDNNTRKKTATKFECSLSNGFYLMVSWGSSISQTASMAFKYVFCDEINKPGYDTNGDEGNALGRIRERMETYPDSKFIKFSTPTTENGRVTVELAKSDVVYDYKVPCPYCGAFQILTFKNVKWQNGSEATRDDINNAVYVCEECKAELTTAEKNKAVSLGQFFPRKDVSNPRHVGLQLHRLSSLFKGGRLSEMVERFINAQKEGPLEMQNVINSIFGEAWVNRVSEPESKRLDKLLACKCNVQERKTPESAICLVAGIDVQKFGFWYRVRAFDENLTSWGIAEGFVPDWESLENILTADYGGMKIWRSLIDTGGGKYDNAIISRTEETYNFIRQHRHEHYHLMGSKGSSVSMVNKIKVGAPLDKTPSGKPIPGGIRIVQINTDVFKDILWWRVEKALSGEIGGFYFHDNTPNFVFEHILAEEKQIDRNGKTDWVAVKKDNHIFDCECLCLACVDPEYFSGIFAASSQKTIAQKTIAPKEKKSNPFLEGLE